MKTRRLLVLSAVAAAHLVSLLSCRTGPNAHEAWRAIATKGTKDDVVAFVKRYRDTQHTPEVIKSLQPYAEKRHRYSIAAIKPPKRAARTHSRGTIMEDFGNGRLHIEGSVEWELNPLTGRLENMFWNPGAEHTIACVLIMDGYVFLSSPDSPLVFRTSLDRGYTFVRGRGLVVEPNGTTISLCTEGE